MLSKRGGPLCRRPKWAQVGFRSWQVAWQTRLDGTELNKLVAPGAGGPVSTLQTAIRHASVTGEEASFAAYLAASLPEVGVEPVVSDFLPGRPNVWGIKRGVGRRAPAPARRAHRRRPRPRLARALGRGPSARIRSARRSWTARSGGAAPPISRPASRWRSKPCGPSIAPASTLAGDVVLAFVGDEESGEPGTGVSAGMKAFAAAARVGRDSASGHGHLCRADDPRHLYRADRLLHLRHRGHRPHRLFRRAGTGRRRPEGHPCGALGAMGAFRGSGEARLA